MPCSARFSKLSRVTKITPVFGALVKVAPSKPVNITVSATPSTFITSSDAARITASVRARVAPGGSWKAAIR